MSALLFSTFDVSRQVFYRSGLAAAIVNLKPVVPGRVFPIALPCLVLPLTSAVPSMPQMSSSYPRAWSLAWQTSSTTSSRR